MKTTKRFIAMAAALALTTCAAMPMAMMTANAATENTVTINEVGTGHTYKVYKIFNGVADGDTLTGITFAKANGFDAFLTALKADATLGAQFTNINDIGGVANKLGTFADDSANAKEFAKFVATHPDLFAAAISTASASPLTVNTDGYYVVVEQAPNAVNEGFGMTSYLLTNYDASEGADIDAKADVPSLEKKIKENASYTTDGGYGAGYNDTADYCIGDTVPFKIIGTLPANIAEYPSYTYVFHDTLGSQFTPNNDIVVKIKNGETETTVASTSYSVTPAAGDTITVSFADLKSAKDGSNNTITITPESKVIVEYSAVLNANADMGKPGQENAAYLEYSNNPNVGGSGTTGKTPTDEVIAFSYELDVTKKDASTDLNLSGAEFVLYKTVNSKDYYATFSNNKITDWVPGTYSGSTFTADSTEGIKTLYGNTIGTTEPTKTSGAQFSFVGLDAGTYYLKEVTAPAGYTKLANDIKVEITANTSNVQNDNSIDGEELTSLQISVDDAEAQNGNITSGIVAMDVENSSSSNLPSTGGMGTTLFILGGGCAAGLAGIYLVSKKRAKEDAE